jgi:hypothetical protein
MKQRFPATAPAQRRFAWVAIATVLALLLNLGQGLLPGTTAPTASAHNLQTRMVYMFFDPDAQACLDARIEGTPLPAGCAPLPPGWQVGDPLLQVGDELGVIIKVVPRDGTTTGVGGHVDFYVPNGVQVVDVGYVVPDGEGGYDKVAMKGQSPIAIGAGPVGAKTTAQLVGLADVYASTASGLSSTAVNPATGLHRGTIAGVYGDTGIFYSTHPDTAYGSWQTFTGDSTANGCGSLAFNSTALGKTLVNNSGDTVVPCNKWDAGQLMAWGVKGGTYGQSAPIVDYADDRGNAPWGFASGVAGPQERLRLAVRLERVERQCQGRGSHARRHEQRQPRPLEAHPVYRRPRLLRSTWPHQLGSGLCQHRRRQPGRAGEQPARHPFSIRHDQPEGDPLGGRPAHRLPAGVRLGQSAGG